MPGNHPVEKSENKLPEHAKVVMYKRPGGYRSNIYSAEAKSGEYGLSKLAESLLPALGSRFYYLWIPGK